VCRYLSNREEREEGGTPNVLGDVKLGLVVHFKQLVGASWIEQEEVATARLVHARLAAHPAIHLLGHPSGQAEQGRFLPLLSFLIQPVGTTR
jgi:selenocysteine lyase/cysteine desulfurase